jgi:hypothetical protein
MPPDPADVAEARRLKIQQHLRDAQTFEEMAGRFHDDGHPQDATMAVTHANSHRLNALCEHFNLRLRPPDGEEN